MQQLFSHRVYFQSTVDGACSMVAYSQKQKGRRVKASGTSLVEPLPVRGSNQIPEIAAWRHGPLSGLLRSGPIHVGIGTEGLSTQAMAVRVDPIAPGLDREPPANNAQASNLFYERHHFPRQPAQPYTTTGPPRPRPSPRCRFLFHILECLLIFCPDPLKRNPSRRRLRDHPNAALLSAGTTQPFLSQSPESFSSHPSRLPAVRLGP